MRDQRINCSFVILCPRNDKGSWIPEPGTDSINNNPHDAMHTHKSEIMQGFIPAGFNALTSCGCLGQS